MPRNAQTRTLQLTLSLLVAANVLLVWLLPVLPQQDLPQHLAYARILRDFGDPSLPFSTRYAPIDEFQVYFTSYYLMRWLSFGASVEVGMRMLMSLYVVGMFAAFAFVVRVVSPSNDSPRWSSLLVIPFIWNPPVVMGFLAYYLGLPLLLAAIGATLGWIARHRGPMAIGAVVASAICALLHPFLGATACMALVLCALVHPERSRARRALLPALLIVVLVGVAFWVGSSGLGQTSSLEPEEAWRRGFGVEFIAILLGFEWSGTTAKINYSLWSMFGPFTLPVLVAVGLATLALAIATRRALREHLREHGMPPANRALLRVALLMVLLGWLVPFGMHRPTELTFIDLRLLSVGWMLAACSVPSAAFASPRLRKALIVASVAFFLHLAYRLERAAGEATSLFGLLDQVDRGKVLMSLVINNDSPHLAKQFRVPHFMPMYYTVRYDGICTQFWARYTHHLPVDYAKGQRPRQTEDWNPGKFRPADVQDSDYVIVRAPSRQRDPEKRASTGAKVKKKLDVVATEVAREGLWVLYRVEGVPP